MEPEREGECSRLRHPVNSAQSEIGPELEIKLNSRPAVEGEWLLALQLRAAVSFNGSNTSGRGVLFNPELEYRLDQAFGTRNDWTLRWKSVWASEDYADYYYEVAPQFATIERPGFDASSGYIGSEFRVGFVRQLSARLKFDGPARLWINPKCRAATNLRARRLA